MGVIGNQSRLGSRLYLQALPALMRFILVVCGISLTVLVIIEVLVRCFLPFSIFYVEEIALFPAFWLYMVGAAYGAYERSHIKVEILPLIIKSQRKQAIAQFIISFITVAAMLVFIWWGYCFFMFTLKIGPESTSVRIPLIYGRSAIFIAGGLVAGFYFLVEMVDWAHQAFGKFAPQKRKE